MWKAQYDWLIDLWLGSRPYCPDASRPKLTGPLCPISIHGNSVTLLKLQMAPRLILLMSSGSKKKEPRHTHLSEAKASHSQRMWAKVSSSAPHLHSGLSDSPSRRRCLFRVLCPVWRPVTALDCVLLKDRNLALEYLAFCTCSKKGMNIFKPVCTFFNWVKTTCILHLPMFCTYLLRNLCLFFIT